MGIARNVFCMAVLSLAVLRPGMAASATQGDASDMQSAICFGKAYGMDGYPVYEDKAASYQQRGVLDFWFPSAIKHASASHPGIYVPSQASVSPSGQHLALVTANYYQPPSAYTATPPCSESPDDLPVSQTTIFILGKGTIREYPQDANNGANFKKVWTIARWVDDSQLELQAIPYDPGAGGSCNSPDHALLDIRSGARRPIAYVRGHAYEQWVVMTADPSQWGKYHNLLDCSENMKAKSLNFYLLNTSTGKYVPITSIDVAKPPAADKSVTRMAAGTKIQQLGGAKPVVRLVQEPGVDGDFIAPAVKAVQEKADGIAIQYSYKLRSDGPLQSGALFISKTAWKALADRVASGPSP